MEHEYVKFGDGNTRVGMYCNDEISETTSMYMSCYGASGVNFEIVDPSGVIVYSGSQLPGDYLKENISIPTVIDPEDGTHTLPPDWTIRARHP